MKPCTPEANRLLLEGSRALSRMEANGIRVDVPYLERTIADTSLKIKRLEDHLRASEVYTAWRKRFGQKARLGSREQLATVLFDVLKHPYPGGDLTATKRYRSDEEVLLKVDDPFPGEFVRWQKLLKLRGTYLYGIRREVVDGYLHPFFNLHTVETYRSSSSHPNFQNQTNRDPELAPVLRRCYVARKGRRLVEVDFSSLEFRMIASFWNDPKMIRYASDPSTDIHRDTAMSLFFLVKDQVEKKTTRDWAKSRFVFPVCYGSYWRSCAASIWEVVPGARLPDGTLLTAHLKANGVSGLGPCEPKVDPVRGTFAWHVREVERKFMADFPGFGQGKDAWWRQYCERGWFRIPTGFVCRGEFSKNNLMNTPPQGAGFHCLLWSLIQIQREITWKKMRAKLVAQIHDCILADVPEGEVQDFLHLCRRVMTEDLVAAWDWIRTTMEIEADCTPVGGSWEQKKPWVLDGGTWKVRTL